MIVSALSVLVNVVLSITLVQTLGYRGLALSASVTAIINASVQLLLLRREIQGLEGSRITASFARVIVASAVMGVVSWLAHELMLATLPGSSLPMQIIRLAATIGVSLATLAGMAQLLRIQEFGEARDLVLRRFKRITG